MEVTELRKTVTELRAANAKISEERERYRVLYQQMLEKARKLELGLLGQKSERMPADELQLSTLVLAGLLGEQLRLVRGRATIALSCTGRLSSLDITHIIGVSARAV